MKVQLAALACLCIASAAHAELRPYCPDRPGLGSPACTVDPGHVSIEMGLADWTLDKAAGERNETLLAGDILARIGVGEATEIRLGWTSFGRERDRDSSGAVTRQHRIGDATIGLRQNLKNPDGSGTSVALTPFVTIPVGRRPIGAGDWGAGVTGSAMFELNDVFTFEFVPEIDAAVDEDSHGRHLAYSAIEGLNAKLSKAITATIEYQALRDRDPGGHATMQLAGLSLGWRPMPGMRIDVGANARLDHRTPDIELYLGVARRF